MSLRRASGGMCWESQVVEPPAGLRRLVLGGLVVEPPAGLRRAFGECWESQIT